MTVQEPGVGASGEGAAVIAKHQSTSDGRGNGARTPADVQRLPVVAHSDNATVTRDPAERFRGHVRPILKRCRHSAIRGEHVLIQVDHDLEALASVSV